MYKNPGFSIGTLKITRCGHKSPNSKVEKNTYDAKHFRINVVQLGFGHTETTTLLKNYWKKG